MHPPKPLKLPPPDQRGVTLQTIILTAVIILAATGTVSVIYNIISRRSGDVDQNALNTVFLEPIGFEPRPLDPPDISGGGSFLRPPGQRPPRVDTGPGDPTDPPDEIPELPEETPNLPDENEEDETSEDETEEEEEEQERQEEDEQEDEVEEEQEEEQEQEVEEQEETSILSKITRTSHHTCIVLVDGTITCAGRGDMGQLGDGNFYSNSQRTEDSPAVKVVGINDATAVAVGETHTCALHRDTTISCWGEGYPNILGTTLRHNFATPQKINDRNGEPRRGFVEVDAGERYTCARYGGSHEKSGRILCWGRNTEGQLGLGFSRVGEAIQADSTGGGSNSPDEIFSEVAGIENAVSLSVGIENACVLLEDGSAACWGFGFWGALGNGIRHTRAPVFTPAEVVDESGNIIRDFESVWAEGIYTCGIRSGNSLWCWGLPPHHNIQEPSIDFYYPSLAVANPVAVTEDERFEFVTDVRAFYGSLGVRNYMCVFLENTQFWCWGDFWYPIEGSQISELRPYQHSFQPLGTSPPVDVSLSHWGHCILYENGQAACWERFGEPRFRPADAALNGVAALAT